MLDQADEAQLRKLAGAYRLSQAIAVAAELRLADLVADTPKTADELAPEVGAHPPTLYRLLRALAGEGIFAESEEGCFSLAPLGRFLVSRRPDSARAMIEGWRCLAEGYRAFGHLRHTVLTGEPGFVAAHGTSFYDYMDLHPERLALYDAATNSTVDSFMPSKVAPDRGLADLQALMVYGGADRTETEWARLFGDAGFQLSAVLPTAPPYSWLEGRLARAPK